ncbi:MAG: universal stress protein [bacterium]|nr:universal stress protein [bacterium]
MKRYERLLVCIDQPQHSGQMLAYVQAIARLSNSKELHLLHVIDVQTGEAAAPPAVGEPITAEMLRALASEQIQEAGGAAVQCAVIEGTPLLEYLRYAHDKNTDLIVIGRHCGCASPEDDEAVLARRITRKSSCSVLVLPEDYSVKADTILVPVRDSECSANALDVACGIAGLTDATVVAFDLYQVHPGYSRVGTTLEEHKALLESAARRECERLLKRVDTGGAKVQCKCAADLEGKPVSEILTALSEVSADLVVIGARGRSGAAGVLLGNVTERLIRESPLPVLAVKKKGECLGVLRALLTLAGEG